MNIQRKNSAHHFRMQSEREQTLVNSFFVIREYGSTLYVGLARAVSPTNTNFRLTFLLI